MSKHLNIADLRLEGMTDLGAVLRDGPPDFSFHEDLHLQTVTPETHYRQPLVDTMNYWGPK